MRILVTNDDGINADGLKVLQNIAHAISDDVWTVAPESEQSGAGHSLTLHVPVRVRKVAEKTFAVSGTPTDCVLLALKEIIPQSEKPVSLVLSGVNRGSNAGDDVTYSGTVAGAMEGAMLGVPSVALSQSYDDPESIHWKTAEAHAPALIKKLVAAGWPQNTFINLNFPDCAPEAVQGARLCPMGKRLMNIKLSERVDPKGRPYYWLGGERDNTADREGVDLFYLPQNIISITPLCLDLTDYRTLESLRLAVAND